MTVESVIRKRKTEKVLCDLDTARTIPEEIDVRNREVVRQAVRTAGWAPFHYARDVDGIAEPWRAHILWQDTAREVAAYIRDDLGNTSKVPELTVGCSALILVTWLPRYYDQASRIDKQVSVDEEHLAATAAMTQNLLLLLTEQGMGTYWGSGGAFRDTVLFDYLGISRDERLLGAIHVEYPEMMADEKRRMPGKLRDRRSDRWIREVSLS